MSATDRTAPVINISHAKADTLSHLEGTKKTKPEVNYRPGNNDAKICHTCQSYENPSQDQSPCTKVVGIVHSSAVCDVWTAQPAVRPDSSGEGQHKVEIKIHTGSSGSSINRSVTERPNY